MHPKYKYLIYLLLGSLLLMFNAFYNGFPIVYSDTSTYLSSGFELETPFDRPITYGIFLRLTSLNGISLWGSIFCQALILSYLIFEITKVVLKENHLNVSLIIIGSLAIFTGVSWTVCQLIPDIFTSIALLSAILILFGQSSPKKNFPLFFLFLVSAAMHLSHLLLFGLIILTIIIFRKKLLPLNVYKYRNADLIVLLLLTVTSVLTMGSALSKSKHVFFIGAMNEHGILKTILDDRCGTKEFKLCAYKDSLPPMAYQFIWEKETSPLYKIGSWQDVKPEFNEIIHTSLTEPKYIKMHISASLKASFDQLIRFKINDGNGSFLHGTLLHERIGKFVPNDLAMYEDSRQSQSRLGFTDSWNTLFTIVLIFSLIIIFLLKEGIKSIFTTSKGNILFVIIIAILLNAWDCGTFANAIDRLGCKMIWLLPMMAMILLADLLRKKRSAEDHRRS